MRAYVRARLYFGQLSFYLAATNIIAGCVFVFAVAAAVAFRVLLLWMLLRYVYILIIKS